MLTGGNGTCDQPFNRNGGGVLQVTLIGDPEFDVTLIDLATVQLQRCDGVGGSTSHTNDPAPEFEDESHPNGDDVGCLPSQVIRSCNAENDPDGTMDLRIYYRTQDLVADLGLGGESPGAVITLDLTGQMLDGTPFRAANAIRLVPAGAGPAAIDVRSSVEGVWIETSPPDMALEEGGIASFTRDHYEGSVVTLTAPRTAGGRRFIGWVVNRTVYADQTLVITLTGNTTVMAAFDKKIVRRTSSPPRR